MDILNYIQQNWVGWLFAALFAFMGNAYRLLRKQMEKQKNEHDRDIEAGRKRSSAIMNGIQALLRQQIIDCHYKYTERGNCPIYAKESITRVYEAYHDLGGNDVATELYEKLIELPIKTEK